SWYPREISYVYAVKLKVTVASGRPVSNEKPMRGRDPRGGAGGAVGAPFRKRSLTGQRNLNTMASVRIPFVPRIVSWGPTGVPQASNARKGPTVRPPRDFGSPMSSLPPRRGAYGFDAPYAPLLLALGGVCMLAFSA